LGKLYELAARDTEALTEYTAFLAQSGDDPRASGIRRRLIRYYENKNQADKVLEQYRALCRLEPANLQARQGLADALYKQSAFDESFVEYQKALSLDPNNAAVHLNIGFIFKMKGNLEDAEREVRLADSLNPGTARTVYLLGSIQFERGDFPGAASSFERTIAIEPEHQQAHYHLSRALARLGRQEDARRELQIHQEIMRKAEAKSSSPTMERP
ncbi:MAG TPA: tetratricopeptide repeat protein, partial [Verrucomicrobiae bacterium]|nr:tetratricopeptide repeat protein [Verrucomicrobiae bacterium]